MATRGYQSYRGRNHGKLALVIVLVLILLAAVGYLVAQEYMVYDDEGHRHLELPFLKKGQTEQPQQPEDTTPDDVDLIIDEPERPMLKELHARQLPDTVLTEDPSAVLAEHPEAVVIPVKLRDGTVTYDTQTAARDTVTTGGPGDADKPPRPSLPATHGLWPASPALPIWTLPTPSPTRRGCCGPATDGCGTTMTPPAGWTPARLLHGSISCSCVRSAPNWASTKFCWTTAPIPSTAVWTRIDYGSVTNLTDTLSVFVEGVREALPKTTALSVLVRDQVTAGCQRRRRHPRPADGALRPHLCGYGHRGRSGLQGLLPADFDPVTRLVQVAAESASSGSYVTPLNFPVAKREKL